MKVRQGPATRARKKKVLQMAKGFRGDRSKRYRRAWETLRRALAYAFRDRKDKKRQFRGLWINRIQAAAQEHGSSYSKFIHLLKTQNIILSRDMLAKVAAEYPAVFDKIVEATKA